MTFKTTILAAVAALAPIAAQADADWTGFYGGVSLGMGDVDVSGGANIGQNSMGLHFGYARDFGDFVLGGEIESARINVPVIAGPGDVTRLKVKGGYDMGEFLPYAFVGVSHVSIDGLSDNFNSYGVGVDYRMTERVRLGAEYVVDDSRGEFASTGDEVKFKTMNVRLSLDF